MRDIESRYKQTAKLTNRSQYKIYYCQIKPAWILTLGINPGGAPGVTSEDGVKNESGNLSSASLSYFENNQHDVLDCEWRENYGLRKLLIPLLGDDREMIRSEVVKTNMAFRRSSRASEIEREKSYDECIPFINEIISIVHPKLILLTGPKLDDFNNRYSINSEILCPIVKKESIKQVVFGATKSFLQSTNEHSLVIQVAHASQWSATYTEYDVYNKINSLLEAISPKKPTVRLRKQK